MKINITKAFQFTLLLVGVSNLLGACNNQPKLTCDSPLIQEGIESIFLSGLQQSPFYTDGSTGVE